MAYQRPMVTVDQNMTIAPTSIERDQPAFIFGPNYELHRYSDAAEKAGIAVGAWEQQANGLDVAYPNVVDPDNVDTGYTKLFGDNVHVQVANLGPALLPEDNMPPSYTDVAGGYTMLLFSGKKYVNYDKDGNPVPLGTEVKKSLAKGDVLLVTYTDSSISGPQKAFRKIADVMYSDASWELDSSSTESEGPWGTIVVLEDAIPLTASGVSAVLADVLDGVEFTAKNIADVGADPKWQWKQTDVTIDGVTVKGVKVNKLSAIDPAYFGTEDQYGEVLYADLFLEYRELKLSFADSFHSVTGASEVEALLGAISPDNPLALGVYMAAINSATDDGDEAPPIYFMAVKTNDKAGYSDVLNTASNTDRAYVFAPTTNDDEVIELVRSHVLKMSTKTVKMWRIGSVSKFIPTEVAKLSSANTYGRPYYAIPVSEGGAIAPDADAKYNKFRIVKASDSSDPNDDVRLLSYGIVKGDRIEFNPVENAWGEIVPKEYTVKRVLNNHTVEIEGYINMDGIVAEPDAASYPPKQIQIYHKRTEAQMAEAAASESRELASRRMLNVFPNYFEQNGVTIGGEFAACAVAGLISATEPQQPITNVTVRGIDEIPITNLHYSADDLDTIAAGGTFIVTQDLPGDIVYVRHQITTAYPDGNLNTAELSITKNVDSISYAFADVFRPYYGKYNITPELIAILENLAGNLISQLGGSTSVYGPQLSVETTKIKYVRQNQLLKDHVDIAITLGVPYPCNNIDIVLTV